MELEDTKKEKFKGSLGKHQLHQYLPVNKMVWWDFVHKNF